MKIEIIAIPENEGGGFCAQDIDNTLYRGDGETIIDAITDLLEFLEHVKAPSKVYLKLCPCCGNKGMVTSTADSTTIFCSCGLRTDEIRGYDYDTRLIAAAKIWNRRILYK